MSHLLSISLIILTLTTTAGANEKSICGTTDERKPSKNEKVGRLLSIKDDGLGICTVTLIGRSCAISAGHCFAGKAKYAIEFNTLPSKDGSIVITKKNEDIYTINPKNFAGANGGFGNDYAVFRINKNRVTGKYPGDVQGHYDVSYEPLQRGDTLRITGYGTDQTQGSRDGAQQTSIGPITRINPKTAIIDHKVDTMGGVSGAAMILKSTGQVVGIHAHGGCDKPVLGNVNRGTSIALNKKLKSAIKSCLAAESNL